MPEPNEMNFAQSINRATADGQNQADAMLLDQSYAFQRFVQSRVTA